MASIGFCRSIPQAGVIADGGVRQASNEEPIDDLSGTLADHLPLRLETDMDVARQAARHEGQ